MDAAEFRKLTSGAPDAFWRDFLGVSPATFRRYKNQGENIPASIARLLRIRAGDLSEFAGHEWAEFTIAPDGRLYMPFFGRGFTPAQLKALFFTVQDAWQDKRDVARLMAENAALKMDLENEKARAELYRRTALRDARYGLMFSKIVD